MKKRKMRLFFTDFWPGFRLEDNFFLKIISKEFEVEITDVRPDYLLYSVFGTGFHKFNCTRIFYSGENIRPDFKYCDYAFTSDFLEDNPDHFRLPLYALYADVARLTLPKDIEKILSEKTEFCNFIYSNAGSKKRIDFFRKLSKYKRVDSGGRVLNNLGFRVGDKLEFIKKYKFTIAFENQSYPGYTTEKIFQPMLAGSIPIYWGNELIDRDFNTKSFLNYHDYGSDEALIERIIAADKDEDLYIRYLSEPFFVNNEVNQYAKEENILNQFRYIFGREITPVAKKSAISSKNALIRNSALASKKAEYYLTKLKRKFNRLL